MTDLKNELADFGKRLRKARQKIGLSQKDFAEKLGFTGGFVSELEYGKAKPGYDFLMGLINSFSINPAWLLVGVGTMIIDDVFETIQKDDHERDLRKFFWYFSNSPLVKYTVLGDALKFVHDNEEIVRKNIEANKSDLEENHEN